MEKKDLIKKKKIYRHKLGTYKVRNEIEAKSTETKRNQWNENEIKRNQWNQRKPKGNRKWMKK